MWWFIAYFGVWMQLVSPSRRPGRSVLAVRWKPALKMAGTCVKMPGVQVGGQAAEKVGLCCLFSIKFRCFQKLELEKDAFFLSNTIKPTHDQLWSILAETSALNGNVFQEEPVGGDKPFFQPDWCPGPSGRPNGYCSCQSVLLCLSMLSLSPWNNERTKCRKP